MRSLYQMAMDDSPSSLKNKDNGLFKVLNIINKNNNFDCTTTIIGEGKITVMCHNSISNAHRTDYYKLEETYTPIRTMENRSYDNRKVKSLKRKSAIYY